MDLPRGRFGYNLIRICAVNIDILQRKKMSMLSHQTSNLLRQQNQLQKRYYGMFVLRAARSLLKIRYLALGGAVSGGYTLQNKYEMWRESLPDLSWIKNVIPDESSWRIASESLSGLRDVEILPRYKQLRQWFDYRLNEAINAVEEEEKKIQEQIAEVEVLLTGIFSVPKIQAAEISQAEATTNSRTSTNDITLEVERLKKELNDLKLKHQNEISKYQQQTYKQNKENLQLQLGYERELDRLKKEISELKKPQKHYVNQSKRSLVELYSEVLDELSEFENLIGSKVSHQLPQVVVVGGQSSGKTSVLEMIANARIFPRGSGKMMTRAPVQVTMEEGPRHVAQFRDSDREYDLTNESDLIDLRTEIDRRMTNLIGDGKTISTEVISLRVRGPGLQRMVLVDLPGTIGVRTIGMEKNTKLDLDNMAKKYMSNPNAIILCILDGSFDAEHGLVTDLVSEVDPEGKRTIFVLTKADLAERRSKSPDLICDILSGKKFIMKALGYFVVVTGHDDNNDSIEEIHKYEEDFFLNSKLFKNEVVSKSVSTLQMTTRNLSRAVAERFWEMVKDNVEKQTEVFQNRIIELESEWKTRFPKIQQHDRNKLFEIGSDEILKRVFKLRNIVASDWDEVLNKKLLDSLVPYFFEKVYVPALLEHHYYFDITADKCISKISQELQKKSIDIALKVIEEQLKKILINSDTKSPDQDVFLNLKNKVSEEIMNRHKWDENAIDLMGKIQLKALEDKVISSETEWKETTDFLKGILVNKIAQIEQQFKETFGPSFSERWLSWKSINQQQWINSYIRNELANFLQNCSEHPVILDDANIKMIQANLKRSGFDTKTEDILSIWDPIYKHYLLKKAMIRVFDGKKLYSELKSDSLDSLIKCNDIKLFWRLHQMLKLTVKDLRQQIIVISGEVRRLETESRNILIEISQNEEKKRSLFSGKRIELAEELIRIHRIKDKLDEFIKALSSEK